MAVLSEPFHSSKGRLLLIKPESFFEEVVDGHHQDPQRSQTRLPKSQWRTVRTMDALGDRAHVGVLARLQRRACGQADACQNAAFGRNQNEQVISYFHAMFVKKGGATKRGLVRLRTNIETKEVFGSPEGTSR